MFKNINQISPWSTNNQLINEKWLIRFQCSLKYDTQPFNKKVNKKCDEDNL